MFDYQNHDLHEFDKKDIKELLYQTHTLKDSIRQIVKDQIIAHRVNGKISQNGLYNLLVELQKAGTIEKYDREAVQKAFADFIQDS